MVCQADTRWWKAGAHDSAKQGHIVSTGPYIWTWTVYDMF
jgi:hypothetical protein